MRATGSTLFARYIGLGLIVLIGGGYMIGYAYAQKTEKAPAPTGKITPWAAMKIATGKVPGRALNANFEFAEGHWAYAVMVVTSGNPKQLKEVEIDPTTGKVGDTEDITPAGEAKELEGELNQALGKAGKGAPEKEEDEKDEKKKKL